MIIINILCDFDNVLCKTDVCILDYYVAKTGDTSVTYNPKLSTWNMEKLLPNMTKEMLDSLWYDPLFFELLQPYDDTIEILNKLKADGHHLHVISCHDIRGIALKQNYISEHFPMIDEVTILTTDLDKSSAIGDILVDDSPKALNSAINVKNKVVFGTYDWNKDLTSYPRVNSLTEFYNYVT